MENREVTVRIKKLRAGIDIEQKLATKKRADIEKTKLELREQVERKQWETELLVADIEFASNKRLRLRAIEGHHVNDIVNSVKNSLVKAEVEPILVWLKDGDYFCVDGRHRLAAYLELEIEKIKCRIFEGSLGDAIVAAHLKNNRPTKSYTRKEKSQRAWEMVLEDYNEHDNTFESNKQNYTFSEKQIGMVCEVVMRTVQEMRKLVRKLIGQGQMVPEKYWEARVNERGLETKGGMTMDEMNEHYADLCGAILRTIEQSNNPMAGHMEEALFRALIASGNKSKVEGLFRNYFAVDNVKLKVDEKIKIKVNKVGEDEDDDGSDMLSLFD